LESESSYGYIISSTFLSPTGTPLPLSFVSHHAAGAKISLRTGCVCNPGGAMALLGENGSVASIEEITACEGWRDRFGIVRMSLGLGSEFADVWRVVRWAKGLTEDGCLDRALVAWRQG
jgi:molybdenum cofactor sulfurtransferase